MKRTEGCHCFRRGKHRKHLFTNFYCSLKIDFVSVNQQIWTFNTQHQALRGNGLFPGSFAALVMRRLLLRQLWADERRRRDVFCSVKEREVFDCWPTHQTECSKCDLLKHTVRKVKIWETKTEREMGSVCSRMLIKHHLSRSVCDETLCVCVDWGWWEQIWSVLCCGEADVGCGSEKWSYSIVKTHIFRYRCVVLGCNLIGLSKCTIQILCNNFP